MSFLNKIKSQKLSWSEATEKEEYLNSLWKQLELSPKEMAHLLADMVERCSIQTSDNPFFFFKINELHIDMLVRNHIMISITSTKAREGSEEDDDDQEEIHVNDKSESFGIITDKEDYDQEEIHQLQNDHLHDDDDESHQAKSLGDTYKKEEKQDNGNSSPINSQQADTLLTVDSQCQSPKPIAATTLMTAEEPEAVKESKENADDSGWETVKPKARKPNGKIKSTLVSQLDLPRSIYVFRDEANSPFIDFIKRVNSVRQLLVTIKGEKWAHGYCQSENVVYDFYDPMKTRKGQYRVFHPNDVYLQKFNRWFQSQTNCDTREFYVFEESSSWDEWKYLITLQGLASVRAEIKKRLRNQAYWAHAYCMKTNELYNFKWNLDEPFMQKVSIAPSIYLERFELWFKSNIKTDE